MASHRLSETYRQKIQASSLGYGGKPKKDQAETVVTTQPHPDAAAGVYMVPARLSQWLGVMRVSSSLLLSGPNIERVLRQFDLTAKYGPCTDVTRKQRYCPITLCSMWPSFLHSVAEWPALRVLTAKHVFEYSHAQLQQDLLYFFMSPLPSRYAFAKGCRMLKWSSMQPRS